MTDILFTLGTAISFGQGQNITATITYTGDCSSANLAQIDLYDINNECKIQNNGINMQGMTQAYASLPSSPFSFTYTIPSIPDVCAAKTLTLTQAALYKDSLSNVISNYYSGTASITLNQCYGKTLVNYTSWNHTMDVIKYLTTNTYYGTCVNFKTYNATIVDEIVETNPITANVITEKNLGVSLTNIYGGNPKFYECSLVDNVCPDNFVNPDGTGGNVCSSNNIVDEDCLPRVEMRCGDIFAGGSVLTEKTCVDPAPITAKNCPSATDCVYKNSSGTYCFDYVPAAAVQIQNADNKTIECDTNNYWCPKRFNYDPIRNRCVQGTEPCDRGNIGQTTYSCGNLFDAQNKINPQLFVNCTFNSAGQRGTAPYSYYCGLDQQWDNYQVYQSKPITVK